MNESKTWFDQFYNMVTSEKPSLELSKSSLGELERTSEANNIKNYFLKPFDDQFSRICISISTNDQQLTSIAFYSKNVLISYEYLRSISLKVEKQFVIYDDQVEYIFTPPTNQGDLFSVTCCTNELSLKYTEEQDMAIKFDNVTFRFNR